MCRFPRSAVLCLLAALISAPITDSTRDKAVVRNTRDAEVNTLVQQMWNADGNAYIMRPNFQGHTSSRSRDDAARNDLLSSVDRNVFSRPTYEALIALFDNYITDVGKAEVNTRQEEAEVDHFLDEMMKTPHMQKVRTFLKDRGYTKAATEAKFKSTLKTLWFDNYSRKYGQADTSGFEHVFVGEYKNNEVQGVHNWVRYYMLEKSGGLDYKGFILKRGDYFGMIRFEWNGVSKPSGSFFIGTSPEFEFALYSLCFIARPGYSACKFDLEGEKFAVTAYESVQNGKYHIGTVFPSARR